MGLEYHNEVKNSFHLKIINIRKKIFCSSEIWTPVPWTKCQSLTHITSQPVGVFFSKIFDVFMQCKLFIAGDSKFWKLSSFKLVFENFWMTKKSKNDEIVLISSDEFNLEFWEQFIIYKKVLASFGQFWIPSWGEKGQEPSLAKLKNLQLELWLEPARIGLIATNKVLKQLDVDLQAFLLLAPVKRSLFAQLNMYIRWFRIFQTSRYQGIVKATVSGVFEDVQSKIGVFLTLPS